MDSKFKFMRGDSVIIGPNHDYCPEGPATITAVTIGDGAAILHNGYGVLLTQEYVTLDCSMMILRGVTNLVAALGYPGGTHTFREQLIENAEMFLAKQYERVNLYLESLNK